MVTKRYELSVNHPIVSSLWEIKATGDEVNFDFFVSPIGSPGIVFFINNKNQISTLEIKNGFVKGQNTKPIRFHLEPNFHLFGIRLHPYGVKKLFNTDAREFTDKIVDIENYVILKALYQLVSDKKDITTQVVLSILEMMNPITDVPISKETEIFIEKTKQHSSNTISDLLMGTNVTMRNLQRLFPKEVGISPKLYLRISRMNQLEAQLSDKTDWIELVSEFNFSDQSHIIKEFQKLRETSPKEFVDQKLMLASQLPIPTTITLK